VISQELTGREQVTAFVAAPRMRGGRAGFALDGMYFRPSTSHAIAAARTRAPTFPRRVTMPTYAIHQEISALLKPPIDGVLEEAKPWDEPLADELSGLQSDANVDLKTQLGCDYSELVTHDILHARVRGLVRETELRHPGLRGRASPSW
jgi:hypothetical protein